MNSSRFKLEVSLSIVCSHIAIFFLAVWFQSKYGFGEGSVFSVLSALIPLFGLFSTIIVKNSLNNKYNVKAGKKVNLQMIWVCRLILLSYVVACLSTFLLFYGQVIKTDKDLADWISGIEVGLGVMLGLIIDDLFGGAKEK